MIRRPHFYEPGPPCRRCGRPQGSVYHDDPLPALLAAVETLSQPISTRLENLLWATRAHYDIPKEDHPRVLQPLESRPPPRRPRRQ